MKKFLIFILSFNCGISFADTPQRGSCTNDSRGKPIPYVLDKPECQKTRNMVSSYLDSYNDQLRNMCNSVNQSLSDNQNNPKIQHQILQNNADATAIIFKEWANKDVETCKANPNCMDETFCNRRILRVENPSNGRLVIPNMPGM